MSIRLVIEKEYRNASKKKWGILHKGRKTKSLLEFLHDLRFVLKLLYNHRPNW